MNSRIKGTTTRILEPTNSYQVLTSKFSSNTEDPQFIGIIEAPKVA